MRDVAGSTPSLDFYYWGYFMVSSQEVSTIALAISLTLFSVFQTAKAIIECNRVSKCPLIQDPRLRERVSVFSITAYHTKGRFHKENLNLGLSPE
jgi:hypothetical protein